MTRRSFSIIALVTALMVVVFVPIIGCEGSGPYGTPLYVNNPGDPSAMTGTYIMGITVTPQGVNMAIGGMQQFKATATYNTGATEVITDKVEWFTENPTIGAFQEPAGRFLSKKPGVAIVRCRVRTAQATMTSSAAWVNSFYPNQDIPPAVPLNPTVKATPEGAVVGWDINMVDGDLAGYNIWRTQVSSSHYSVENVGAGHYAVDYGKVNQRPILYPPYLDSTVVSGWYYYRVTAEDLLGLMSPPSEEVAVYITGISHYGKSYDSGSSFDANNYKDSFSTAF